MSPRRIRVVIGQPGYVDATELQPVRRGLICARLAIVLYYVGSMCVLTGLLLLTQIIAFVEAGGGIFVVIGLALFVLAYMLVPWGMAIQALIWLRTSPPWSDYRRMVAICLAWGGVYLLMVIATFLLMTIQSPARSFFSTSTSGSAVIGISFFLRAIKKLNFHLVGEFEKRIEWLEKAYQYSVITLLVVYLISIGLFILGVPAQLTLIPLFVAAVIMTTYGVRELSSIVGGLIAKIPVAQNGLMKSEAVPIQTYVDLFGENGTAEQAMETVRQVGQVQEKFQDHPANRIGEVERSGRDP